MLNVSSDSLNTIYIPYYYGSGSWGVQVKQINGTYMTGTITINTLYIDRK